MSGDNQSFSEPYTLTVWGSDHSFYQEKYLFKTTWVDSRVGTSMPDWRQRVRQGINATTVYSCDFQLMERANAHVYCYGKNRISGVEVRWESLGRLDLGWGLSLVHPASIPTSVTDASARGKFIAKYRQRRTQFQAGVFLGELAETVQMIRHPAQALRNGINSYYGSVKKRLRKSKNRKRTIQDTWLEYVFGWAPLINDIEDACRLSTADPYKVFQQISCSATSIHSNVSTRTTYTGNGAALCNYTSTIRSRCEVKLKGAIGAENNPPPFPEQLGLSWSNVLPTVWELIPYSFLVDYFSNVGKVIDGISTGTISLRYGSRNTWRRSEQIISNLEWPRNQVVSSFGLSFKDFNGFATGGGMVGQRSIYNRDILNDVSFGFGDFAFRLPGSNTKWLNIAALARLRK